MDHEGRGLDRLDLLLKILTSEPSLRFPKDRFARHRHPTVAPMGCDRRVEFLGRCAEADIGAPIGEFLGNEPLTPQLVESSAETIMFVGIRFCLRANKHEPGETVGIT